MAAAAAVVFAGKSVAAPVIKEIVTKALSYLGGYFSDESMEEMRNKLDRGIPKIQAALDVVSPDHNKNKSEALDAWFWQLRDAVEEAENAVDELEYYELEENAEDHKVTDWGSPLAKMKHKVVRSVRRVSFLDKTVKQFTHHDTLKRLKKAMDGLDRAAADITSILTVTEYLKGATSSNQRQEDSTNNCRETGSMLTATKFVGREAEKKRIMEWLTKTTSVEEAEIVPGNDHIPILSIVGHGGMGKTTLAQSICKQAEVVKDFKIIWVTVSTNFEASSVITKILESATGESPSAKHLETLQKKLEETLMPIKFLLILDDVWEEGNRPEWENLFAPLRSGKRGSKILLTTRMESVAHVAANVMGVGRDFFTLEELEEDENLALFNHHVFSGLNSQDYRHLKLTGEQIARKLGGCPLVTKVASGHLQDNMTSEYWNSFLHKGLEHFRVTEAEDIMKVLRLSYHHLPTELQICFRYCSLFPQDYEFKKQELMQLWMGSGLISQVPSGSVTFEDTAEQLLARLTRKSFFDVKSSVYGYGRFKTEYYVMHDLMHDLARNVSSGECARITDPAKFKDVKDTVRHLCVDHIHDFSVEDVKKFSDYKNLRTLIIGDSGPEVNKDMVSALGKIVESSRSLRLLHSRLRKTFHFSDKFGNLKHLRYISLHQLSPEGIGGVVKLYHLMLLHCKCGLRRQPKQVRYLGNLERLRYVSYGVSGLGEFPISRLTSLQELYNYRVQGNIGNKISAIRSLRGIRMLQVKGLENVENHEEGINAKLKEKQYLNSLSLKWSVTNGARNRENELVLDHLEPHGNISELQISGYEGLKLPFWIENMSLINLVSLRLESCINWGHLPSLGELVLLKHLTLYNLPKLKQIGQSSDMSSSSSVELLLPPSLGTLEVSGCQELKELPILPPSLVSLRIKDAGLTKLPMIFRESVETKPSQLLLMHVFSCPCLTSLEGSLLEEKLCMGALRDLQIRDCKQLESASIPFEEMNELEDLGISSCPKLRTVRDAKDKLLPSSLTYLTMGQCGDLELPLLTMLSLQRLTNLSSLVLHNCSRLVSLPSAEVFTSLKSLRYMNIAGCENLSSLGGLGSLPSLWELEIIKCIKLVEAGSSVTPDASAGEEEHLLQIHRLYIDHPSLLLVEPLKSLCHTRSLIIKDGSEMERLPEQWLLQNRSSLRYLTIWGATSLGSLPSSLRDFSSLEMLSLDGAPQIRSLPDLPSSLEWLSLSGAPQIQSLPDLPSSLRELSVSGCDSELEKKTREYGSPEWYKITHIQRVRIGQKSSVVLHDNTIQEEIVQNISISRTCRPWEGSDPFHPLGGLGSLPSLGRARIFNCIKLVEAGSSVTPDASAGEEEHLLQIQSLQIDHPSLLLVEPLKSLCHTQELQILDGSEMESLPERWLLQNRSSLRSIWIWRATSLGSLPSSLRDFSSLEELRLDGAPQIRSLPDLPSSLRDLSVSGCDSELEKKTREYGSPEWNTITHIHRVQIGNSFFIMGKVCSEETFDRLRYSDDNTLTSWVDQQKDDKILESLLSCWKKRCCLKNDS